MTCSLRLVKDYNFMSCRPALVDATSTDESDLRGITVRRATLISHWVGSSVTIHKSFGTTKLVDFVLLRPITLR